MRTTTRFTAGALLFAAIALIEMVGGAIAGSIAVVSDGMHNISDALALTAAVLALRTATRRDASETMHYGYHRLEVLSALANGVLLLATVAVIATEAILGLRSPNAPHVELAGPLVAASVVANVAVALGLRPHGEDIGHHAAYLHILADAAWSVAVLLALIVIRVTGYNWIDSVAALAVAVPVAVQACKVVAGSGGILLQKSHVSPGAVASAVRGVSGVIDVPDLRVWHACSYLVVGTAHVVTDATHLSETARMAGEIRHILKERFGIGLVTLEFESPESSHTHSHEIESSHPAEHR
jgi:cobalt-zinc-cadmium efflux system protein